LIVGADQATRSILSELILAEQQYSVFAVGSFSETHRLLNDPNVIVDAVILDIQQCEEESREFCATLRRGGHSMPVIMLGTSNDESEVVRGLNAGASDYVARPLRAGELLARLRAHLRSAEGTREGIAIGRFVFRPALRRLHDRSNNRTIRLTIKETEVLQFLHRCRTRSVDRQTLLHQVWGYRSAVTHTVETHVFRLRQKLETDPKHPVLLTTDAEGYRLHTGDGAEPG
jgi:DNA-binding response OmpR family regulator